MSRRSQRRPRRRSSVPRYCRQKYRRSARSRRRSRTNTEVGPRPCSAITTPSTDDGRGGASRSGKPGRASRPKAGPTCRPGRCRSGTDKGLCESSGDRAASGPGAPSRPRAPVSSAETTRHPGEPRRGEWPPATTPCRPIPRQRGSCATGTAGRRIRRRPPPAGPECAANAPTPGVAIRAGPATSRAPAKGWRAIPATRATHNAASDRPRDDFSLRSIRAFAGSIGRSNAPV